MKKFLVFLDKIPPIGGFLIYQAILYSYIFIATRFILKNKTGKPVNFIQVLGIQLVLFAIFIVADWENPYVQYATRGSFETASNVFYGSEDGIIWSMWSAIIPLTSDFNINLVWVLTFIVSSFVIAMAGLFLVKKFKL